MNDIQILMAMVTGLGIIMLILWKQVNGRLDKVDVRFDKLDEKLTDVDRRLCRLEGAFSSKECCMLHHHDQRKAE